MKAVWNNKVLAESSNTIRIEGNHYFPPEDVNNEYLKESSTHTICPWKGKASYYNIVVGRKKNIDAAWYYPNPKDVVTEIRNYVAFWRGVEIVE